MHESRPQTPDTRAYQNNHVTFDHFATKSAAFQTVLDRARVAAVNDGRVLLLGETGTSKNFLAKAIHQASARAARPFVEVNLATYHSDHLASELFGFEQGAFTGASRVHLGAFARAHGGTLFLDEIGCLPLQLQAALLRAVDQKTILPLGGKETLVDVRILAATNLTVDAMRRSPERFRADLYYRLAEFVITLPTLAERPEDILDLFRGHLAAARADFGKPPVEVSPDVERALLAYAWPGNVRELKNAARSAALDCGGGRVEVADLPDEVSSPPRRPAVAWQPVPPERILAPGEGKALTNVRRRHVLETLAEHGGDVDAAARSLRIHRATLYRLLGRYRREA